MDKPKKIEIKAAVKYTVFFAAFLFLNNAVGISLSPSLLVALLFTGASPTVVAICFMLSFTIEFEFHIFMSALIFAAIMWTVFTIYNNGSKKPRAEIILYVILGELGFFFLKTDILINKIAEITTVTALSFVFTRGVGAVLKDVPKKPETEELTCFALLAVACGLGQISLFGEDVYRCFSIYIILCSAFIFNRGENALIAVVLGFAPTIAAKNPTITAVFAIWGLTAFCFRKCNKLFSGVIIIAVELALSFLFGFYENYGYSTAAFFSLGVFVYIFTPQNFLETLKNKRETYGIRELPRESVNRERALLAGKLSETAAVFNEINGLLLSIGDDNEESRQKQRLIQSFFKECKTCNYYENCSSRNFPNLFELERLFDLGVNKGGLTAVDLPPKITSLCHNSGMLLKTLNKQISAYGDEIAAAGQNKKLRELFSVQSESVAEALRQMAVKLCKKTVLDAREERKLADYLKKRGIFAEEIMLFGEKNEPEIQLICEVDAYKNTLLETVISDYYEMPFKLQTKYDVRRNRAVLSFGKASRFDCSFGLASRQKDGSIMSGDSHTLTKLSPSKFLLALSDGMGSGEKARTSSELALTLIESLYKAGLPSQNILKMANRLLSALISDSFSALDIAVVDLDSLKVDFLKLGAPNSFVISSKKVKLIEGNSLPLGIVNEVSPNALTIKAEENDIVMFLSDGVADAFGSSSGMLEFLTVNAVQNPQSLAKIMLNKALSLYGNAAKDDMTVLTLKLNKSA